ncbi:uncharacterized protein LOC122511137 [Leptopilina heterotoma]|uniref:uncharacterized protein LOC122511137 n=1 Tax=Leptopilina heterotoma TaxID=63436 RepID=UPI001CA9D2B5|nr:uncharacterized protein LOC122511137 [Leptopilina heterotoma]
MGDKSLFLLDSFSENGKFYIVRKSTILVTDESEIEIGRKVQFAQPKKGQDIEMAKIKTGKIVMKSESEKELTKLMNKMKSEIEKKKITKEEMKEEVKREYDKRRLEIVKKTRQGNIEMAKILQKELNAKMKKKDLLNELNNALRLTEEEGEELLKIKMHTDNQ